MSQEPDVIHNCPARLAAASLALVLVAAFQSNALAQERSTVVINKPRSGSTYMIDLMKLALSYSDTDYRFTTNDERLARSAQTEAVRRGDLSVMWAGTNEELEQEFIPVRIDGYRGLMSMRFFIIREGEQERFDRIKTIRDLQQLTYGQGRGWQDGEILEHSGLKVERSNKKQGLFYMLEGGRFDAFPRGATEAWREAAANADLDLTVEKKLVVSYPLPTYFFVHKGYPELAQDIEAGLEQAIADGSMDEYFYNNDRVKAFLKNANLAERRVIELKNPFLPAATPLDRKELWLTLEDLVKGAKAFREKN